MLFKLARSGIRGRKKESFLLGFVILLSIIFVVTSSLLHTSSQAAKIKERIATFGPWENAYMDVSKRSAQEIKSNNNYMLYGESQLMGDHEVFGLVGTYNKDYENLSDIRMIQGRMPTNKYEVAIENNQIAAYPYEINIGDQIEFPIVITLDTSSENDILITQLKRILSEYNQVKDVFIEAAKGYTSLAFLGYPNMETFLKNMDEATRDEAFKTLERYIHSLENHDNDLEAYLAYTNTSKFIFIERNQRYSLDTDIVDDKTVNLKTYYNYDYSSLISKAEKIKAEQEGLSTTLDEDYDPIISKGSISKVELIFTYTLTVTGFYDNHSDYWDIGDYKVPSVYATQYLYEDMDQYIQGNSLVNIESFLPLQYSSFGQSNILVTSKDSPWHYYHKYENTYPTLITNGYSYPKPGFTRDIMMTYSLLALIFVATTITVFQINLSQLKRRAKRFTLLKAIGMVKGQMFILILWEILLIVALAFPLGTLLGFGITYGLIYGLNNFFSMDLSLNVDVLLLSIALLSTFWAVILGMAYPVIMALKNPLRGAMNAAPTRRKRLTRKLKNKPLTFFTLSISHLRYEKKKTLMSMVLYTISITVLTVCLFLAFLSFNPYRDQVIAKDKPDYVINTLRGISNEEIESISERLNQMTPVKNHQIIKYNIGTYVHHDDFYNHDRFKHHYINRDYVNLNVHEKATADFKNKAIITNIYGLESGSYAFKTLTADMADFDLDKFNSGQGIIVLLPQYHGQTLERSLAYKDRHIMERDYPLKSGDTLTFGMNMEPFLGDRLSRYDSFGTYSVIELLYAKKEILATGHHTGRIGLWPFSETLESPVIITSIKGLNQLYPSSKNKVSMSLEELKDLIETSYPTTYGKSYVNIYCHGNHLEPDFQLALKRLSVDLHGNLEPLYLEKNKVFNENFKLASIIMTLGLCISLLLIMVLYNTSESNIENERRRIGILQGLGVTSRQYKQVYFLTGLVYGLMALMFANLVFVLLVLSFALNFGGPLWSAIESLLWMYPFKIHIIINFIFLLLAIMTTYIPILKTIKQEAIYNINSNQRS